MYRTKIFVLSIDEVNVLSVSQRCKHFFSSHPTACSRRRYGVACRKRVVESFIVSSIGNAIRHFSIPLGDPVSVVALDFLLLPQCCIDIRLVSHTVKRCFRTSRFCLQFPVIRNSQDYHHHQQQQQQQHPTSFSSSFSSSSLTFKFDHHHRRSSSSIIIVIISTASSTLS